MDSHINHNDHSPATGAQQSVQDGKNEDLVIPVIEETIQIGKQSVETGKVRIVKTVSEDEQLVELPLVHEEFTVERIAVNDYVDSPPAVRYEGDTTIYPVLKEVLVIEKKLVLVEEVHVTKRLITRKEPQKVTIRREEISVDRSVIQPERPAR